MKYLDRSKPKYMVSDTFFSGNMRRILQLIGFGRRVKYVFNAKVLFFQRNLRCMSDHIVDIVWMLPWKGGEPGRIFI